MPIDQQRNLRHADYPEPGDIWREMCLFVAVIAEVTDTHVLLCRHRKDISPDTYMIDFSRMEWMPRATFARWVRYRTGGDTTWCEVGSCKLQIEPGDYERPPFPTEEQLL